MSAPAGAVADLGAPVRLAADGELLGLLAANRLPTADLADSGTYFLGLRAPDGALVAAGGFERHGAAALLRSLAVAPAWRGRGLGWRIVEALLEAAHAAGVARLFLLTETAEPFFARMGFARIARAAVPDAITGSAQFTSLCPSSAAAMTLLLDRPRERRAAPGP